MEGEERGKRDDPASVAQSAATGNCNLVQLFLLFDCSLALFLLLFSSVGARVLKSLYKRILLQFTLAAAAVRYLCTVHPRWQRTLFAA